MQHIDAPEVWQRLPMLDAIAALEQAIRTNGFADTPQRLHLQDDGRDLLVMPAMADGWAGVKLVSLDPQNPARGRSFINGVYTLFVPPGLEPGASIEGRALTELRTAAVSGLATRHLARPDASRLTIFGAGAQGRSHLLAMAAVRDLTEVRIVAPRAESVDAFIAFAADHLEVEVRTGTPDDVATSDIVCTCTSSATPVFDGSLLPEGVHINAIGAYRPDLQEVDAATVLASRVIVELREAALTEKGDLLRAAAEAGWDPGAIAADLTELLRDPGRGRMTPADRTLFSSVGHAYEDLLIARAVVTA
ncbi:MAG: ornithine cyclodeaminase family protein [Nitriliruptor sp.]|nr:MAG: ornithine cyclodeaminase family protein [Nitriliruptor sp.]